MIPIGDTPNPRGFRAWVTWSILAANVLVYLLWTLPLSWVPADPSDPGYADLVHRVVEHLPPGVDPRQVLGSISRWDLVVERWGFRPGAPSGVDLLASLFLHSGLLHVAGNMLFLGIYGDNVEHRLGRVPYLVAYLGWGVAATLVFAFFATDPMTPLVGASGAISGVLGCYAVLFPRNRVRVLVVWFPFLVDVWLVPARLVLGLFVVLDNLLPFLVGGGGGVAYGAHLGGFAAGVLVALVVRHRSGSRATGPREDPERLARAHLEQGLRLLEVQPVAAYQHLAQALELTRDPELAGRVRALLDGLHLDPRLRRRLGLG